LCGNAIREPLLGSSCPSKAHRDWSTAGYAPGYSADNGLSTDFGRARDRRGPVRLGSEPDAPWIASTGPRQAHLDGFDLHADLRVAGHDRRRLEHFCRYLLRPPVAQDRLRLLADGRVLVQLKPVWADGTSHLLFEPLEFLEKLAALTPRPRINLIPYHGVLVRLWLADVDRVPDGLPARRNTHQRPRLCVS
jgi:Putative transposase